MILSTNQYSCKVNYFSFTYVLIFWQILLFLPFVVDARQLISLKDALNSAFKNSKNFEREVIYLSEKELEQIQSMNSSKTFKIKSQLVIRYKAIQKGNVIGYSYIDTHQVRTLSETILVSVNKSGHVTRIEVLNFNEPSEYLAPKKWLEQFRQQKVLNTKIIKRDIYGITGASLTAEAIKRAVLRVSVLHHFIQNL